MIYILAQIFSEWVCGFLVCTVCVGYPSVCVVDRHVGQKCKGTMHSHQSVSLQWHGSLALYSIMTVILSQRD